MGRNTLNTNKMKRKTTGVSLERAKQIIADSDPLLTREIVDKYTDSEIKEWCKALKLETNF